jgi:hypothetical protein
MSHQFLFHRIHVQVIQFLAQLLLRIHVEVVIPPLSKAPQPRQFSWKPQCQLRNLHPLFPSQPPRYPLLEHLCDLGRR